MKRILFLLIAVSLFGCAVDPNAGSGVTSSVTPEQKVQEAPAKKLKVTVYSRAGEVIHVYHDVTDINTYSAYTSVDIGDKRFYFNSETWAMSYEEDSK